MKNRLLILCALFFATATKAQTDFSILVQPYTIPGFPGLHSYAAAAYNGKWVLIGGRTEGLHQRQPTTAFLSANNNTNIYVVDPVSKNVWTASVNSLPDSFNEQLQSSNMLFCYEGDKLYIAGGYGYSATIGNHKTFTNLVVVDLPGLINAVINNVSINSFFRQLTDNIFAVTGGQMAKQGDMFLLVGGQQFDGRYNPNNGPSFTQVYSNQIRKFKLADNGTALSISYQNTITDANELHRRDYNMVPQVFPDRRLGYTAFSGVFQNAVNLPFLNTVDIDSFGYSPNNSFNQLLNHYHSGKIAVYDSVANAMHSIFFGGMAQYYYNAGGNLVQDNEVPFVSTIGKVTRAANGTMSEMKIGDLTGFIGTGAEVFINHALPLYSNEVIKLNAISQDTVLAGYLAGGISSIAPNIFFVNTGTQSAASNNIYKILLVKNSVIPVQLVYFRGVKQKNIVLLEWKTATEQNNNRFEIERSTDGIIFSVIGSIPGSGNSDLEKVYSYKDISPAPGLNYYRLKQINLDETHSYSSVILIRIGSTEKQFLIYPNPVNEKLIVEFDKIISDNVRIRIIDINGRELFSQSKQVLSRQINLNTAGLSSGSYFIEIVINGKTYADKFIKK